MGIKPGHVHTNAQLGRDPTQTTVLRNQYSAEMYKRWRRIKGFIRTTIVDNDAFRLKERRPFTLEARGDFGNVPPAEKVDAFMGWLRDQEDSEVLEIVAREGGTIIQRTPWQNLYVRRAYQKGVEHADRSLTQAGMDVPDEPIRLVFQKPVHAEKLALLFERNFQELYGIAQATNQQVSRMLADGLAQGQNPRTIASRINDRVDNIGITRSRTLARTEIIRAHAESTLTRFEEFGVDEVGVLAEFSTAGDARVCPICEGLEGTIYPVDEARGLIPAHPRCRCAWLPVTQPVESSRVRFGA